MLTVTLRGWRNGSTRIPWRSTKGRAKPFTWRGITSRTSTGWGPTSWKAAVQRKPQGVWGTTWLWASDVPSWQKRPVTSWAASCTCILAEHCQQVEGATFSLPLGSGETGLDFVSSFGLPSTRASPAQGYDWSIWRMRRGWDSWEFFIPCRRDGLGGSYINVHLYLMVESKEDASRLFSVV